MLANLILLLVVLLIINVYNIGIALIGCSYKSQTSLLPTVRLIGQRQIKS